MIHFDVLGSGAVLKRLGQYEREIPFVVAKSLTQIAKATQADLKAGMEEAFDKPTRYTLNSLAIKPATKTSLFSAIFFKDGSGNSAFDYLQPQIEGGERKIKPFEKVLSTKSKVQRKQLLPSKNIKTNRFGNITKGRIDKFIKQTGKDFFYLGSKKGKLRPGLYKRNKRTVRLMLLAVSKSKYDQRFDYFGIARASIGIHSPRIINANITELLEKQ